MRKPNRASRRRRNEVTRTRARPAACEAQAGGIEYQPRNFPKGPTAAASQKLRALWASAAKAATKPDEEEEPPRRRRQQTEGEFARQAILFYRLLQARKLTRQFVRAGRKRVKHGRGVIRLSYEEWGDEDAHLQTTLNLFDQINSNNAAQELNNRSDVRGGSNNHFSSRL